MCGDCERRSVGLNPPERILRHDILTDDSKIWGRFIDRNDSELSDILKMIGGAAN
jgi:hypothetical protein